MPSVVDLDPQGSACTWSDLREAGGPAVVAAQAARLARLLDAAPRRRRRPGGDRHRAACVRRGAGGRVADLVLILCRASVADLHAIESSLDLCQLAGVQAEVLLNAVPVQGQFAAQAQKAMADQGAAVAR